VGRYVFEICLFEYPCNLQNVAETICGGDSLQTVIAARLKHAEDVNVSTLKYRKLELKTVINFCC